MAALTPGARAFLMELRFAALATLNKDGSPQQSAMWYDLEGETILMNTTTSRAKYRNLVRDPRASVCVVDGYRAVIIGGHAELDDDQAVAQADIKRLAIRYLGPEKGEQQSRERFSQEQRVTIRLTMEQIVEHDFAALFV
jgi:PPOX class probable F420-dependent enzyme